MLKPEDTTARILILVILLFAAGLRFTGLDWGTDHRTGTFHAFHPDETTIIDNTRWVGTDLAEIVAPYGKAPMYALWVIAGSVGTLTGTDTFDLANNTTARFTYRLARFITAVLGLLTVWLVFRIGERLGGTWTGLLSAFFLAFSAGHIQQSHHYTVEITFTFWVTLSLYLMLKMPNGRNAIYVACGITSGLAAGTRLAGVWLGIPFIVAHLLEPGVVRQRIVQLATPAVGYFLLAAFLVTVACEPFLILDPAKFFGESDILQLMGSIKVVTGESLYVWTLSDFATTPYLFHITNLMPLAFGAVLTIVSILGVVLVILRRPSAGVIILSWLLVYFLFIGRLHSKPFRYMVPLIPVFVVLGAWVCIQMVELLRSRKLPVWVCCLPILAVGLPTGLYGLAFTSIYHREDGRFQAQRWIAEHIDEGAGVLTERGGYSTSWMVSPDRYARRLDDASFFITADGGVLYSRKIEFLEKRLEGIDWIVIIRENRLRQFQAVSDIFPVAYAYYKHLDDGSLGFETVANFKSHPQFAGLSYDEQSAEPTFSAFDHPHITIYKRRADGDLTASLSAWKIAVESDPGLPDFYLLAGVEAYREGNFEAAYEQFDRSLQIKPDFVLGNVMLRAACLKLNREDEAQRQWLAAASYPTNKLIQALATLNRMELEDEEMEFLGYTSQMDRKSGHHSRFMATYANIGTRLVNEERWTAAVGALQRATDFWDAPADTWFLLAKSYEHTGELGKSWYALDKAIELNPVDPAYHVNLMNLGTQLYNKGSVLEASAVYLKAIELDSTLTEAYLNLGVLELGENRLPQAEKWIQQAAALAPEDSQIQLYLGVILMKTGKLKTARAALQRVLDLDPQNQEARTLLQTLNP